MERGYKTNLDNRGITVKKFALMCSVFMASSFFMAPVFADAAPVLNTVNYQTQVKKWVTTDSVDVVLSVNVTTKDKLFDTVQQQVMQKLAPLSGGKTWNVDNFTVSQDQSGLQVLSWQFSSRLPLQTVNLLQSKIESLSQAGQQFKILNLNFQPSLLERQNALAALRQEIYQQAKAELERLNNAFPKKPYFLHRVDFNNDQGYFSNRAQQVSMMKIGGANQADQASAAMGSEITLNANIELANNG